MLYPKIPLAQTVVTLCKAKAIKHIVISPGSRNAPLTIGFTEDSFFKSYSIVDERCAAFFALGMAQQLQQPVAIVCTSGSALLNYYPAVAEAFYSNIPLLVISADRPKHLVGIGDGQTIIQKDIYKNHCVYSTNLKVDITAKDSSEDTTLPIMQSIKNTLETFSGIKENRQTYNTIEINKAINLCLTQRGPVHINVPFKEPLYEVTETLTVNPEVVSASINKTKFSLDHSFSEAWKTANRKLILVGVLPPNQVSETVIKHLAADASVIVLTETTSNLHNPKFFNSIDKLIGPLNDLELNLLKPDILVTFGGLVVSKKIKAFLRNHTPKTHWHIGNTIANNTYFCLETHFKCTVNMFFETLYSASSKVKSEYYSYWENVKQQRNAKHLAYLKNIPFSDFKVFNTILQSIPDYTVLQVGNSSAIRYTQLFNLSTSFQVFCNRGTSGIDGCTSTAIGAALASKKPTICITGDLSFLYDSNALWNNYIPSCFRVIVVNNSGGGIFRILPGKKDTANFDTFFETKHNLTAKQLCEMYNFEYLSAKSEVTLNSALNIFYKKSSQPKLLEIFTPSKINDQVLKEYFTAIK